MLDFFRTGQPQRHRPDRYREAIQRLTVQDIAIFFEDVLGALPQLVEELSSGGRVLDIHCGGALWLIAMARRFPSLELVGIEAETDSVERARRNVRDAGLEDRVRIVQADLLEVPAERDVDLAYYQYALHQLSDPPRSLRNAWSVLRPGGRIAVLDWPLPSTIEDLRTPQGELIAVTQLNEAFGGTSLATREAYLAWFAQAALPEPQVIELPAGAAFFTAVRSG
jgi:ubiquinone/menaquinone biosynthesis C-methylase UbiE